jgi:two-component system, LytTR family, response regulator
MIKTIIIEDNYKSSELLESHIANLFNDLKVVGCAENIDDALKLIYNEKPDLIFLDINLNTECGFDILNKTNTDEFEIIITTSYSDYAIQAIKNSAIDFILKPYEIEELKSAVNKAKKKIALKRSVLNVTNTINDKLIDRIFISTINELIFIKIDEIIFVEGDSSYSEFNMIDGSKVVSSKRLAIYEELLKNHLFVRVHKSYLVNLKYIKKYQRGRGGYLSMTNGKSIKVSENKKEELMKFLMV